MVEMRVTPGLGFLNVEKIEKVRMSILEKFKKNSPHSYVY